MPKHVIIGGGPAGINAIEAIRELDPSSSITLISNEPSYARTALPDLLANQIGESQLQLGGEKYFRRLNATRRDGRVTRIATKTRQVELEGGGSIPYDNLLIATGSSPQRPPIAGASGKHVHTLWTLADARALMASADMRRPSVVVVGAGFIGLAIVNALHKVGWKISLVEMGTHILPKMLDRRGAEAVEGWLRERSIEIHTGVSVTSIAGGRKKTVALSDGQQLTAHIVILATGSNPNIGFLRGSGIKVDKGIIVDDHMRTNVAGIYAAGDVAQGPDILGGAKAIHAIQSTAVDHGRVAGANMAGHARAYAGSLMARILDIAELRCASFGRWSEGTDTTAVWDTERRVYRKLVWDGGRLVGGILLGPIADTAVLADVEMLRSLIQSRIELGSCKEDLQENPRDLRRVYVASGAASNPFAADSREGINQDCATATG
jgi:NAD(P)H-nitrite reductase large subunit